MEAKALGEATGISLLLVACRFHRPLAAGSRQQFADFAVGGLGEIVYHSPTA
jgi:hypothetical protein